MLNLLVIILAGLTCYCLSWIRAFRKLSDIDDETIKTLKDIIVLQDKQISNLNNRLNKLEERLTK